MVYNEIIQRGTADFPLEYYRIEKMHPRYVMTHHWHAELEIVKIISGKLNIRLNDRQYCATEGDVVFVNSDVIHSAVPENCVYDCIVFDARFFMFNPELEFFILGLLNHDLFINEYFPKNNNKFHFLIEQLYKTMSEREKGHTFSTLGLMLCLFGEIENNNYYEENLYNEKENIKYINKLKKVLNFVRNSYERQITLEEMAEVAGVSPKYFCSFFKDMTTKTPIEYLNSYRINIASHKLRVTDDSVTDIAYSCGFNDLSYFIKVFKKEKGITPKKFCTYSKKSHENIDNQLKNV